MYSTEQVYASSLQGVALLMDKLPQKVKRTFTNLLDTTNQHDTERLLQSLSNKEKLYFIKASVYLSIMTKVSLPLIIEQNFSNPTSQKFIDEISGQLAGGDKTKKHNVSKAIDKIITSYDLDELTGHTERAFFLMNNPLIGSTSITADLYFILFIKMLIFVNQEEGL